MAASCPIEVSLAQVTSPTGPHADARAERVAVAVGRWQRDIAGLGGPNTLLWYAEDRRRALDLTTVHPGGLSRLMAGGAGRLSDLVREPAAAADARLAARAIADKASELATQRGVQSCFIAFGMATWHLPDQPTQPAAPVILRSCRLAPTSAAASDFALTTGEDAVVNRVLLHYLTQQRRVRLDQAELEEALRDDGGLTPHRVYQALERACAGVPGFTITPRILVTTWNVAKLPMALDLMAAPESLVNNDLIAALAGDPDARRSLRSDVPASPPNPDPAREVLALDATYAEQSVVEAARAGASLVVDALPGTRVIDTTVNTALALAVDGKRVLVLSSQAADLVEVASRLDTIGLGWLARTATGSPPQPGPEPVVPSPAALAAAHRLLRDRRDQLLAHTTMTHERWSPWEVTIDDVQRHVCRLASRSPAPTSTVRLPRIVLTSLSAARIGTIAEDLTHAASRGAWNVGDDDDPWYGVRLTSDDEVEQARALASRLTGSAVVESVAEARRVLAESHLRPGESFADWCRAVDAMVGVRETLEVFRPEIFEAGLDEHIVAAGGAVESAEPPGPALSWVARGRVRRQTSRLLRPGKPPADIRTELLAAREHRAAWVALTGGGARPRAIAGIERAAALLAPVRTAIAWLDDRRPTTLPRLAEFAPEDLQARLDAMAAQPHRLDGRPRLTQVLSDVARLGLAEVVEDLAERRVPPDQVRAEVEFVWWASLDRELVKNDTRYKHHDGVALQQVAREYADADREHVAAGATRVRATLSGAGVSEPLIMLGSPTDVAMHLPETLFDATIVLGSSRLSTAVCVPALRRSRRVLAFGQTPDVSPSAYVAQPHTEAADALDGDDPPGSLFSELTQVVPHKVLDDLDPGLDARLWRFADRHLLTRRVRSVPAPPGPPSIWWEPVDGRAQVPAGDDATIESTPSEVDRVVSLVLEHAASRPDRSLAVITLSRGHAAQIEHALRERSARHVSGSPTTALDAFDERHPDEPFVVVEARGAGRLRRDCVIAATGFAKTLHGRVLYTFGALGGPDGPGMLTAASTAARRHLTVVSALTPDELDPDRLRSPGAQGLARLLSWAIDEAGVCETDETHVPDETDAPDAPDETDDSGADTAAAGVLDASARDDPIAAELAARLRHHGLTVRHAWGDGEWPVDLVVRDGAGQGPWVAVELDGPRYAACASVRERDRQRPDTLRAKGFAYRRVWSTDVFRDPARDVAAIVDLARPDGELGRTAGLPAPTHESGTHSDGPTARGLASSGDRAASQGVPTGAGSLGRSRDDGDVGWGERADDGSSHDRWLEEQRPPHWG